jgi:hypothetical protein
VGLKDVVMAHCPAMPLRHIDRMVAALMDVPLPTGEPSADAVRIITECEINHAAMRQDDRAVQVVAALRAAGYELVKDAVIGGPIVVMDTMFVNKGGALWQSTDGKQWVKSEMQEASND